MKIKNTILISLKQIDRKRSYEERGDDTYTLALYTIDFATAVSFLVAVPFQYAFKDSYSYHRHSLAMSADLALGYSFRNYQGSSVGPSPAPPLPSQGQGQGYEKRVAVLAIVYGRSYFPTHDGLLEDQFSLSLSTRNLCHILNLIILISLLYD